jgi:hypothetical protein
MMICTCLSNFAISRNMPHLQWTGAVVTHEMGDDIKNTAIRQHWFGEARSEGPLAVFEEVYATQARGGVWQGVASACSARSKRGDWSFMNSIGLKYDTQYRAGAVQQRESNVR